MITSGIAMVILGVWLTLQAIGGNLTGRIRSIAGLSLNLDGGATRDVGGSGDAPVFFGPSETVSTCEARFLAAGFKRVDAARACAVDLSARP